MLSFVGIHHTDRDALRAVPHLSVKRRAINTILLGRQKASRRDKHGEVKVGQGLGRWLAFTLYMVPSARL